jgi:hypothetical protein
MVVKLGAAPVFNGKGALKALARAWLQTGAEQHPRAGSAVD